ncbi:MAG: metallophosphoesterase family protein [Candidatus Nanoarchaeia archaeon]
MEILFCADVHGNEMHYFKILERARNFDVLVFGGDLCPKNLDMQKQREFLENYLIPRLNELKQKKQELKIFLMLGNDDFAYNYEVLKEHEKAYQVLDKTTELGHGFYIRGYPFVPITPFRLKDWEKWDMNEKRIDKSMQLQGIKTWNGRYEGKVFTDADNDSIENDMSGLFESPQNTIYVFHAPPFKTKLDIVYSKEHVGSRALRNAIEKYQPLLTLHGHIHETVDMSGEYLDRIGDTICASAGNHHTYPNPAVLEISLPSRSVKRVVLD